MSNTSITGLPVRINPTGTEWAPIQALGETAQRVTLAQIGRIGIANAIPASIQWVIDGGGGNIAARNWGSEKVPFAATLTGAEIVGDQTGSIVVDIWKCTYAEYNPPTLPTSANSITGGLPLTISSAVKATSTLVGWTTTFAANDFLTFVTTGGATNITRVTIALSLTRVVS